MDKNLGLLCDGKFHLICCSLLPWLQLTSPDPCKGDGDDDDDECSHHFGPLAPLLLAPGWNKIKYCFLLWNIAKWQHWKMAIINKKKVEVWISFMCLTTWHFVDVPLNQTFSAALNSSHILDHSLTLTQNVFFSFYKKKMWQKFWEIIISEVSFKVCPNFQPWIDEKFILWTNVFVRKNTLWLRNVFW